MSNKASSLLLLNSYGKDDEDEEVVPANEPANDNSTSPSTEPAEAAANSAFQLVGYSHDDDDEGDDATTNLHNLGDNVGRAVINPPRLPPEMSVATPPPSSPSSNVVTTVTTTTTTTTTTATTTTATITVATQVRGTPNVPLKCEAFLPPEPSGSVDPALQSRILDYFEAKAKGKHINDMRYKKQYKNPDILEKLVTHCSVQEIGSNYPVELFNPYAFEPHDYYDAIAVEQKKLDERRNEDRTTRTNIEFTSSTTTTSAAPKVTVDDKKRSKWDSMEPAKQQIVTTVVTGAAPQPTTNAYVEYIRDRKKRETQDSSSKDKDANKKQKK